MASKFGANHVGENLSGKNFVRAHFRDADLRDVNLSGANLTGANFTGADLTGTKYDASTVFEGRLPVGFTEISTATFGRDGSGPPTLEKTIPHI